MFRIRTTDEIPSCPVTLTFSVVRKSTHSVDWLIMSSNVPSTMTSSMFISKWKIENNTYILSMVNVSILYYSNELNYELNVLTYKIRTNTLFPLVLDFIADYLVYRTQMSTCLRIQKYISLIMIVNLREEKEMMLRVDDLNLHLLMVRFWK